MPVLVVPPRAPLTTIALLTAIASLLPMLTLASTTPSYQGFGASTPGGADGDVVRVTTLADAGRGSLRQALGAGNRRIVFQVAGVIELRDHLWVRGPYVTIDGHTAPPPGITLSNFGLVIRGNRSAHDVIVRGLRIRGAAVDGIQVSAGAYNVVIDHVSVHGSRDGNIDITENSRDVTVSWSVLAEPAGEGKNMLIKYNASRVSLHHNLFVDARQRNPQVRVDDAGTPATDLSVDMRNNVVWNWRNGYGARIWYGARANVVNNYFGSPSSSPSGRLRGLMVCRGDCDGDPSSVARAWVEGNVGWNGTSESINGHNTETAPFSAAPVSTEPACVAAARVVAEAGAQPRDRVDVPYVAKAEASLCQPL